MKEGFIKSKAETPICLRVNMHYTISFTFKISFKNTEAKILTIENKNKLSLSVLLSGYRIRDGDNRQRSSRE